MSRVEPALRHDGNHESRNVTDTPAGVEQARLHEASGQRRLAGEEPKTEAGRQRLGERSDPDDRSGPSQAPERWRRRLAVEELAVRVILHHQEVARRGQAHQLGPTIQRGDRAGGVVEGRDRVEEARPTAFMIQLIEGVGQRVEIRPVPVALDRHHLEAVVPHQLDGDVIGR